MLVALAGAATGAFTLLITMLKIFTGVSGLSCSLRGTQSEESDLMNKLLLFVSAHTHVSLARLDPTIRLLQDLGVDGDDAEELLLAFSAAFDIDLEGFNFSKHFSGEPHLLNIWRWKDIETLAPVTMLDLYFSVVARKFSQ